MVELKPTHHYSQQAGDQTQKAFEVVGTVTIIALLVMIFTGWWWPILVAVLAALGFAVYLRRRPTVTLLDVTTNKLVTAAMPAWRAFQKAHPDCVEKAGKDQQ